MGMTPGAGAQARDRAPGRGRHPRPRIQGQRVPVADVGRPAAARDDRDGDRLRAEAPDRRRADDRARRDDPEADPRPHRRAAEEAPDVGAVHHARPRGRRRDRRLRGRDARRRDPGAGPGEARVRGSAGPLHEGAAAVPAAPRPAPGAAAGDRRFHGRRRARDEPDRAAARHRRGRSDHPRREESRQGLLLARGAVRPAQVRGGEGRLVPAARKARRWGWSASRARARRRWGSR